MTEQEPFSSLVVYHEWSCSSSEHSPEDSFEGSFESKVGLRPSEKDDTDIDFNSDEICAMMAAWDLPANRANATPRCIKDDSLTGSNEIVHEPARRLPMSADPSSLPSKFQRRSKKIQEAQPLAEEQDAKRS